RGEGLSTEIWWTERHPFTSSLTGQTAAELAAAFPDEAGGPPPPPPRSPPPHAGGVERRRRAERGAGVHRPGHGGGADRLLVGPGPQLRQDAAGGRPVGPWHPLPPGAGAPRQ